MREFSVGLAVFFLIQILRPRKLEIQGFLGFAIAIGACYGLGTLILRLLP